jgi:mono/diheme cytochrome c family protein
MKATLLLTIISSIAIAAQAASVDVSKLPPASEKTGLTFAKDIKPIFEASCVRCHGVEKAKGKLRLDSAEGAVKGSEHGAVIKPGNSQGSPLVIAISRLDPEMTMPPVPKQGKRGGPQGGDQKGKPQGPPAKPLTPEEVGLVRAWIDQGAK